MVNKEQSKPRHPQLLPELFNADSTLSEIGWPGSGSPNTNVVLAMLFQLQLSQWWHRDDVAAAGLRQLGQLVDYGETSAFHRRRFAAAGIKAGAIPSAAQWQRLPVTDPSMLAEFARDGLVTIPAAHGDDVAINPGNGLPTLQRPALSAFFDAAIRLRELQWHGRDPGAVTVVIDTKQAGAPTTAAGRDGWVTAFECLSTTNRRIMLDAALDPKQLAATLATSGADVLECPSATLAHLVRCFEAGNVNPPALAMVRVHGEVPAPGLRAAATSLFGAAVRFHFATPLTGAIAFACREAGSMHVQGENVYVEVVDAVGAGVADGQSGDIVVTDLHNLRLPVPRFSIGWRARLDTDCTCGRGLPVLADISRTRLDPRKDR